MAIERMSVAGLRPCSQRPRIIGPERDLKQELPVVFRSRLGRPAVVD